MVVGEVIEVDPLDPRAVATVQRYADDLAATLGFPAGSVGVEGQDEYRRPRGAFLLVVCDGDVVGCAALRGLSLPDGPAAEVKRMWVAPEHRGHGLGRGLLDRLHGIAAGMGHRRIVLDSRSELAPALRLYTAAGYRHVPAFNDNPDATVWLARPLPATDPLLHEHTPT